MRFVCAPFGSSGDVFPMFGLALELRERGHDVTLATNPYFAPTAARYEVPFEPIGTIDDFKAVISSPDLWNPRRAFGHLFGFLWPAMQQHYALIERLAATGPLVNLTNCMGIGALVAQEKLGTPCLTINLQPSVIWSERQPPMFGGAPRSAWLRRLVFRLGEWLVVDATALPRLNAWRGELGLPPIRQLARRWHSPLGIVCLFPEWFAEPQTDWPTPTMMADFPLWNDLRATTSTRQAEAFLDAGPPPLVFTPGSANLHGREFFVAALQASQRLGQRAIFLTDYPEQLPEQLPSEIIHLSYIPLEQLLPRAAAMIHHGGIGTMSQTLAAGIPQLIMPLAHDQFDNAARVEAQSLGGSLSVRQFTGRNLSRLLEKLLGSTDVATACRQAAERLSTRDGLRHAADAIEACLAAQSLSPKITAR